MYMRNYLPHRKKANLPLLMIGSRSKNKHPLLHSTPRALFVLRIGLRWQTD